MEQYTLNRFYFEAKALLEKYSYSKNDYRLSVSFDIEQNDEGLPRLRCRISYEHPRYDKDKNYIWSSGATPANALQDFEESLRKETGKSLLENLSVEIPETTS